MMENEILIKELEKLLRGGNAHAGLNKAVADLPVKLLGEKPHGLPYSIWQLVEHIRISQWDMVQFSKNADHKSPNWPEEFWPKEAAPIDEHAFAESLKKIDDDLEEFIELLHTKDLYEPIPNGDGQTILLEALQIADHNAYHLAEIIVIRRLLGAWKS